MNYQKYTIVEFKDEKILKGFIEMLKHRNTEYFLRENNEIAFYCSYISIDKIYYKNQIKIIFDTEKLTLDSIYLHIKDINNFFC